MKYLVHSFIYLIICSCFFYCDTEKDDFHKKLSNNDKSVSYEIVIDTQTSPYGNKCVRITNDQATYKYDNKQIMSRIGDTVEIHEHNVYKTKIYLKGTKTELKRFEW